MGAATVSGKPRGFDPPLELALLTCVQAGQCRWYPGANLWVLGYQVRR